MHNDYEIISGKNYAAALDLLRTEISKHKGELESYAANAMRPLNFRETIFMRVQEYDLALADLRKGESLVEKLNLFKKELTTSTFAVTSDEIEIKIIQPEEKSALERFVKTGTECFNLTYNMFCGKETEYSPSKCYGLPIQEIPENNILKALMVDDTMLLQRYFTIVQELNPDFAGVKIVLPSEEDELYPLSIGSLEDLSVISFKPLNKPTNFIFAK